jgi:hypothetical protein
VSASDPSSQPPLSDRAAFAYAPDSGPDPLAPDALSARARAGTPRGLVAVALAAVLVLVAIIALDPLGRQSRPRAPARTEASADAPRSAPHGASALSAS